MLIVLAAAAAAAAAPAPPPPPAEPGAVQEVEIVTQRAVVGDLQAGVVDFRPDFFTPVRPATALDMIKWLPGFTFEDTRDLRGLGGAIGNVLIDGQPPTSKTDTLQTVLSRIPSSQVERVDLIVGGAPGIDMRGRPIIANVILKKTARPRIVAQAQGFIDQNWKVGPDFLLTRSLNRDGRLTEWSINLARTLTAGPGIGEGPWIRTDGTGARLFAADVFAHGRTPWAVLTGAHERPVLGGKLKLNGSVRVQQFQLDEVDYVRGSTDRFFQRNREDYWATELGLRYERALSPRTTLETQLLDRRSLARPRVAVNKPPLPTYTHASVAIEEDVARATVRFKRDETLTVEGAAEAAVNGLDTRTGYLLNGVAVTLPGSDVAVRETRGDAGLTVTWKPNASYSLIAAVRGEASRLSASRDVNQTRDVAYLKPRVVLSYAPDKETQLRLRLEREVQQISFYNFAALTEVNTSIVRLGNPNILPESAWVAEATLEKRFWNGASFTLTGRRSFVSDVLDARPLFSGAVVVTQMDNIGDGRRSDLIGSLTVPLKRFGLDGMMVKGGATVTRTRVTDPTNGERRRFSLTPAIIWDAHLTHDLPYWKLTWGVDATYFGRRFFFRPTTFEDLGYNARVNLFIEHRPNPTLTLRWEFDNLTDYPWPQEIRVFSGVRDRSPLLYRDDKRVSLNQFFYFRVRKTIS